MRLAEFEGQKPWLLPIEHWSASSLNMLSRCPRQWQQRYVQGRKEAPGAAVVLGSAFHNAAGFNFQRVIDKGEGLGLTEVVDYFNDFAWPKEISDKGGIEEIAWDDQGRDIDGQRALGALMVSAYHENVAPRVQPIEVEHGFLYKLEGLPVPLKGSIDVVQIPGRPIIDMKSSKSKRTSIKPDWALQGRIYQLVKPEMVDWHVVTKAKQPTTWTGLDEVGLMQELSNREETRKFVLALSSAANAYMATYGPDDDWPQLGVLHPWSCDWCAYRGDCPAWAKA